MKMSTANFAVIFQIVFLYVNNRHECSTDVDDRWMKDTNECKNNFNTYLFLIVHFHVVFNIWNQRNRLDFNTPTKKKFATIFYRHKDDVNKSHKLTSLGMW